MVNSAILLVTAIYLLQCAAQDVPQQSECGTIAYGGRRLSVSIKSERNDTGEWVTTFSALKNSSRLTKNVNLVATHAVTECQGNHIVHIQGIIRENSSDEKKQTTIFFHKKCSITVVVINNGRTVQKTKMDNHGLAITHRPLMDNELFEVRLDKRNNKLTYAIGIGVTIHSPNDIDVPEHINAVGGTWMVYYSHLYHNGTVVNRNYLKQDLNELKIGGRVGVMRSNFGALHFYWNGVDQGPATLNVPYPVFGVFELFGDAVQGTIINPPE